MATGAHPNDTQLPAPSKISFFRSLRGRLIIVLTVFVGLTALMLGLNDYRYVRAMLRDSVQHQLTLQAEGLREVLRAYIAQQQERAQLVASRTRLRVLLREYLDGEIDAATLQTQASRILTDARDSTNSFRRIRIANGDGVVITATDPTDIGRTVVAEPAFVMGLQAPTLGVPFPTDDGFQALLSAPARTNLGRPLGVVLVDITASPMHDLLNAIPSEFATAEVRVATRVNDRIRYLFPVADRAEIEVGGSTDVAMSAALDGKTGFMTALGPAGKELLAAYRPVAYRGWGLVTQVDADEAYAPIAELRGVVLVGGLIVAAIALLVGIRVAAKFTRPVLDLAGVAVKVGAGDLTARASVSSHDEVGVMARAFNAMTDSLQRHQNQLEDLVRERTLVLHERTEQLQRSNDKLAELCRLLEDQADVTERDLHRAEVIQRSLLPQQLPPLPDFCVHTLYRPGRSVGGDLYDVIGVGDRYLVLVIADASGHGVSAAMLAVLFKHRLRVVDETTGEPYGPAAALATLNGTLIEDVMAPGTFFTAIYCLLDIQLHTMVVASAGHPPLLCLRQDGSVDQYEHTGPALGLFRDASFAEHRLDLAHGDRVLLYTDGLFDVGSEGPPEVETIAETLRTLTPNRRLLEQLLVAVSGGRERADRDDVTMLLLDAQAGDSHFYEPSADIAMTTEADDAEPELSIAELDRQTFICITGRMTWTHGEALLDTAMAVVEGGRELIIDLRNCEYLDSTMLGTLHEIVRRADAADAPVWLQGVRPNVLNGFRELSMDTVLNHVAKQLVAVPRERKPLEIPDTDLHRQRTRLLAAHEELAALSDGNQEQFAGVVDSLRADQGTP